MLKFARTACHFMSAQGFSVTNKHQLQNGSCGFLWKKMLDCVEVIMAETQHAKLFQMRLYTRCLRSVVVCIGNRKSSTQ